MKEPSHMDWARGALRAAKIERLSIDDCLRAAEYANTGRQFDRSINDLAKPTKG